MKNIVLTLFISAVLSGIVSCKKDTTDDTKIPIIDQSYVQARKGNWWLYESKKIYTPEGAKTADTLTFYRLDSLVSFTPTSESIYLGNGIIKTYTRNDSSENWTFANEYEIEFKHGEYLVKDDGTKYLNLKFPVEKGKSWDAYPEDSATLTFTITDINQDIFNTDYPEKIKNKGFYFVTIDHGSSENAMFASSAKEQYAQNIGMIYKEDIMYLKMQGYNAYEDSFIYKLIDFGGI